MPRRTHLYGSGGGEEVGDEPVGDVGVGADIVPRLCWTFGTGRASRARFEAASVARKGVHGLSEGSG